jgi:carbonic anhydrase
VTTVVVLGHIHCGAVAAALDGNREPALASLITPIHPNLGACEDLECAVPADVNATVAALMDDPRPLGDALRDGRVAAQGAVVDLADGSLTRLTT